jgi:predicted alternative tryptophan synthase beta-subunit
MLPDVIIGSHAIRAVMDEARACKETGESKAIPFGLSGHGLLTCPPTRTTCTAT